MSANQRFREAVGGLLCGLMWLGYFVGAVAVMILLTSHLPRPLARFLDALEPEFLLFVPLIIIGVVWALASKVREAFERKRRRT